MSQLVDLAPMLDFDNDAQFLLPLRWLVKFMLPKIFSEILDRFFVMEVTMRLSLS